uniref:Uncharacterized protein n=1 Tax=Arundo donax TaxID=35708 RepID=A0A0A9FT34_ARUDO
MMNRHVPADGSTVVMVARPSKLQARSSWSMVW